MRIAPVGSRRIAAGSIAIEGRPLGYRRLGWQGRKGANCTRASMVQGARRLLAVAFGRKRGKSVQTDLEEWSAPRSWCDS